MSDEKLDSTLAQLADSVTSATVVDLDQVREQHAEAEPAAAGVPAADDGPPPSEEKTGKQEDNGPPPPPPKNKQGLPDGCPVVALGKNDKSFFFIDAMHQLIELSVREMGRNHLAALFAPNTLLAHKLWPRWKQDRETMQWHIQGFKAEECGDDLRDACGRMGIWEPRTKLRGPGAWQDDDGNLVLHCGDVLVTSEGELRPGVHDRYVYPAAEPQPHPWPEKVPGGTPDAPGHKLLELLRSWNWERSEHSIDAMLALGWIGAALVGGALDWRPMVFVIGDAATGKSTFHKLIEYLFDGAIVMTADTTAAGIYSQVQMSTMPVAIDELEGDAKSDRQQAVMKLARLASSSGVLLRGSSEQKGKEFKARSCFLFSAILPPPLRSQDLSRMALLRLNPLDRTTTPPVIDRRSFREIGRQLKRRMFDQWYRFQETYDLYKAALARAGHVNRATEQFGTLLACADLLLADDPPHADNLAHWEEWLKASEWRETASIATNAELCLAYLCQSQPDAYRGGSKRTVSECCASLLKNVVSGAVDEIVETNEKALAAAGLKLVRKRTGRQYLAVPNNHRQLMALFADSDWAGIAGVAGGWAEALPRLDGALANAQAKINGKNERCTLVPVEMVCDVDPETMGGAHAGHEKEMA